MSAPRGTGGRRFCWPWRDPAVIRAEVDEEIAFHLDMRARDLEREGLAPDAARTQAAEEFGNVEEARRTLRRMDRTTERGRRRRDTLGQILARVVRHGLGLAAVGVALGVVAALGLTGFLRSFLVEISPTDPATFAALAALLVLVAGAACLLPALRATRVDPSRLLRAE